MNLSVFEFARIHVLVIEKLNCAFKAQYKHFEKLN